MIPGYDDYHERVQKGLPPYTYAGLVAKIDAQQKEIEAADSELMNFQVNLTELLKMDWPGGVCPSNGVIMAALSAELDRLHKIARCFKRSDANNLNNVIVAFKEYFCNDNGEFVADHCEMLSRLQAAAKLAEETCK